MKKILCLLLALIMTVGLLACSGSGDSQGKGDQAAAAEGLQIGYAKIDVTPSYSVGLSGYSDAETRKSEIGRASCRERV